METDEFHVISCWSNDRTTFRTQGSHLLTSSQTEGKADLRKHDPSGEIILLGGQLPTHRRKFPETSLWDKSGRDCGILCCLTMGNGFHGHPPLSWTQHL